MAMVTFRPATHEDATALAALHTSVAAELTRVHGRGPWSTKTSPRGVLLAVRTSHVYVAQRGTEIVATFRLAAKKPWAIDVRYFTPATNPLYLLAMAVVPSKQHQGLGRKCFAHALKAAAELDGDAIRLDAYDAPAGAGDFYARCGCTERGRVTYRSAPLVYYQRLL